MNATDRGQTNLYGLDRYLTSKFKPIHSIVAGCRV